MGMTEPGAGSDAVGMTTTAVRKGDRYLLNGTKTFITNGGVGDVFCVYAKTDKGKGADGMSVFIVEKTFAGFSVGKDIHKMGHRASSTTELVFEDCEVPADNMMGRENEAYGHFKRGLDIERITISGTPVGMMRRCLDVASKYALERRQFGKPIASYQMIKQMLADGYADMRAAKLLVYNAAFNAMKSPNATVEAAVCKLFNAVACSRVCANAVQILGGYGYTREYPVERMMRDAKLYEIGAGTNEIQRLLITKGMLGA
jgi:isovaleryl-CoA dehydrogenase